MTELRQGSAPLRAGVVSGPSPSVRPRGLSRPEGVAPTVAALVAVAALYFGAAQTGFVFAFATKQVTAVWPPTGLALAALVLGGIRLWPGVAAGAFIANITANEPLLTAVGITVGNTLEAVAGAWLLSLLPGFQPSLARIRDVLALGGAALASTLISATIGVASLLAGGLITAGTIGSVWRVWWLGDVSGDLLVAPVVLVFGSLVLDRTPGATGQVARAAGAALLLGIAAVLVFSPAESYVYLLLPAVFAVGLRFRQTGAALGSLVLACVAIWATRHGEGPFAGASPDIEMLRAQTFVAVVGLTALLVAAIRTERAAAEEQVALVARMVAERTAELSAANRELEAFSYSVSHDLRAPLRAINGYSKAIVEDYAGVLDSDGVAMLQRMRSASQRMAQLIDEMLMLSQLTRKPMHRRRVDLGAIAHEVADELCAADPGRSAEFAIDPGMVVVGDAELLRTVVRNLLENAWKFSSGQHNTHIEFSRRHDGTFVVKDNGAGFDMRYADKLFRPFERLHTQTEFPGSGVGLTTVQRVIRRHGGEAWAEGRVGEGAAFYFTLPTEEP